MFCYKGQFLIINNLRNTKKYKKLENHLKIIGIQNSMTALVRRLDIVGKQIHELEDRPAAVLQNIVQKDRDGKYERNTKDMEDWLRGLKIAERNQSSDPANQNEFKAERENPHLEILQRTHRTSKKKKIP